MNILPISLGCSRLTRKLYSGNCAGSLWEVKYLKSLISVKYLAMPNMTESFNYQKLQPISMSQFKLSQMYSKTQLY